jgi:hypothetical protein
MHHIKKKDDEDYDISREMDKESVDISSEDDEEEFLTRLLKKATPKIRKRLVK